MTEKGCDNCYYSYFDEKAYPCSLCIRGIERTDMWQPSKKTKAEAQTEITSCVSVPACLLEIEDEPQADGYMTAEQTEDYRKMLDKAEHKVYGNIEDEPQTEREGE